MGRPVAALSGTLAVTVRLVRRGRADRDPTTGRALNRTLETCLRWRAADLDLGVAVALWTPPQVAMQTTSPASGGLGGVTTAASAAPEPRPLPRTAMATATAAADADLQSAPRWRVSAGPQSVALSRACGVSCRARAERAALRTSLGPIRPGTAFDAAPLVPPLRRAWPRRIRQVGWAAPV